MYIVKNKKEYRYREGGQGEHCIDRTTFNWGYFDTIGHAATKSDALKIVAELNTGMDCGTNKEDSMTPARQIAEEAVMLLRRVDIVSGKDLEVRVKELEAYINCYFILEKRAFKTTDFRMVLHELREQTDKISKSIETLFGELNKQGPTSEGMYPEESSQ